MNSTNSLRKSLWGFRENRVGDGFQYASHDRAGQWFRSYGNELWEFDEHGLMHRCDDASRPKRRCSARAESAAC